MWSLSFSCTISMSDIPSIASSLDAYFSHDTMSIHIKAGSLWSAKCGKPWNRRMEYSQSHMTSQETVTLINNLLLECDQRDDALVEIERQYSKVLQLGAYRIVIVYPPLSDNYEITAVRPLIKLWFDDYQIDPWLIALLDTDAKGILIAWSPGSGKTTFAQWLVDRYAQMDNIVKTIESPRDLNVDNSIVQYSFTHGTHDEIRDILLLSRPDYAIYDEVRNLSDFVLYKDLRLTGIGLIGVLHATQPIDAVQRFLPTVSLGMIPQVIDTIIFIKSGQIDTVYRLSFTVKVPSGMLSEDLARPVVEVKDILSWQLVYELYTYGEQVVVMPLATVLASQTQQSRGSHHLAQVYLQDYFAHKIHSVYYMSLQDNHVTLYVDEAEKWGLIGKGWDIIRQLEWDLHISISIKTLDDLSPDHDLRPITPHFSVKKKKKFRYT